MIHGCIEDTAGGGIRSLHLHLGQFPIPCFISLSHYLMEIPVGNLCLQVLSGVGNADSRETYLNHQRAGGICHLNQPASAIERLYLNRLRELSHKEILLVLRPSCREAMTSHSGCLHLIQRIIGRFIPSDTLEKVEYQLCLLHICPKGIAMETSTLGGGKFHPYIRLLQFHRIIARAHILISMMEEHFLLMSICHREECYITQFSDTRTAEVLMTEADKDGV